MFHKKEPNTHHPAAPKKTVKNFPANNQSRADTYTTMPNKQKKNVGGGTNKRTSVRESRSNTLWNRNHKENQHISRIYRVTAYQFPLLPTLHRQTEKNGYCFRGVVRVIP